MNSLIILGRQPSLGLAELESLYGPEKITPLPPTAALLDIEPGNVQFERLGGSVKLAKVLNELPFTDWREIEAYLAKTIPDHLQYVPEGKFKLGISVYGLRVNPGHINQTGLKLKKIIKASGRSVRVVPNRASALNSAQVLHNQLTSPTGWELVLVRHGQKTLLTQTVSEQDIEAYARRDQNRPKRDARVGMLPPKLAQVITNLAVTTTSPQYGAVVLDPFCGTGVLLQEASLMGFDIYGSDIDPRMVEYADYNLRWLENSFGHVKSLGPDKKYYRLETGDATNHHWSPLPNFVACETFLGKPLSSIPSEDLLQKIIAECDQIHEGFLKNLANQTQKGFRLCMAVPAWKTKSGFKHLPTLDKLSDLGYTRIDFVHARPEELVYHRPDQIVARELVVLERK